MPVSASVTDDPDSLASQSDVEAAKYLCDAYQQLQAELGKIIVGQDRVVEEILIAIFARGHCVMQGVPGLAKTLLVSTLSQAMELSFQRIQFTPDLMPSDITGTDVLQEDPETGRRRFEFLKGPIFANLLLADEINRTPPKTQAALLQAMQEQQVTVGNRTLDLPQPFFVLSTQNPIEQEGTYPLPKAQLDRFMFMVIVNYPPREDELEILERTTGATQARVKKVINAKRILELQEIVRRVPVGDHVYNFVLDLTRATRPNEPGASDFVRHWLNWGTAPGRAVHDYGRQGPRLMRGRLYVTLEDVEAVAPPVLRHRIIRISTPRPRGSRSSKSLRKSSL